MIDAVDRLKSALADRYLIDRELGRGGMAVVYLARDRKLNRQVALKVLRPELAASLGAERFLREIEIAAKLTHPNILGLYDCVQADARLDYTHRANRMVGRACVCTTPLDRCCKF